MVAPGGSVAMMAAKTASSCGSWQPRFALEQARNPTAIVAAGPHFETIVHDLALSHHASRVGHPRQAGIVGTGKGFRDAVLPGLLF